jgi:hypothetical protein
VATAVVAADAGLIVEAHGQRREAATIADALTLLAERGQPS